MTHTDTISVKFDGEKFFRDPNNPFDSPEEDLVVFLNKQFLGCVGHYRKMKEFGYEPIVADVAISLKLEGGERQ